jgi:hypothetical protein
MTSWNTSNRNSIFAVPIGIDSDDGLVMSSTPFPQTNLISGKHMEKERTILKIDTTLEELYGDLDEYKTLSRKETYLLRSGNSTVEGANSVFVLFESCQPLQAYLTVATRDDRLELFGRLYESMASMSANLSSNPTATKMKANPLPYIYINENKEPKFMLFPHYNVATPSFATRYNKMPDFLFEVGCLLHLVFKNSLPENNGFVYRPPTQFTHEYQIIIDKLIDRTATTKWDLWSFQTFRFYINSTKERARFLINLVTNCTFPKKDTTPDIHKPQKQNCLTALKNLSKRDIFYTTHPQSNRTTHSWRSAKELVEMERMNNAYRSTMPKPLAPRTFGPNAKEFLDLFRHFTKHSFEHTLQIQYEKFMNKFHPSSNSDNYTRGDFMTVVHDCFPLFFIVIFNVACKEIPNVGHLFVPTQ